MRYSMWQNHVSKSTGNVAIYIEIPPRLSTASVRVGIYSFSSWRLAMQGKASLKLRRDSTMQYVKQ